MEKAKAFGSRLKKLISISGVERGELAARLGVSVPVVSRWLNGVSAPDVYQLQAMARYFGLPCAWFLDGGDGFPTAAELAIRLGLGEETVSELLALAAEDCGSTSTLKEVDAAVRAVLAVIDGVHEDLCRCADGYAAQFEGSPEQRPQEAAGHIQDGGCPGRP